MDPLNSNGSQGNNWREGEREKESGGESILVHFLCHVVAHSYKLAAIGPVYINLFHFNISKSISGGEAAFLSIWSDIHHDWFFSSELVKSLLIKLRDSEFVVLPLHNVTQGFKQSHLVQLSGIKNMHSWLMKWAD